MTQRDDDVASSSCYPVGDRLHNQGDVTCTGYMYDQYTLCKKTDCPVIHDHTETCVEAQQRVTKEKQ